MSSAFSALKTKFLSSLKPYPNAILVNALYAIICVIITTLHLAHIISISDTNNDFAQYYYASQVLLQDPVKIYDQTYLMDYYNVYPFRYFPSVLVGFFLPLTLLPLPAAFIVFSGISFIANLVSVFLVMEILRKLARDSGKERIESYIAAFLIFPFFLDFFVQGQISSIFGLVLLLSLNYFVQKKEELGCFFLGLSLFIKPISFFHIFFILFLAVKAKDFKLLCKRAIFIVIPLVPDFLWFMFTPNLLTGFLRLNFSEFNRNWAEPSVSFSNFLVSIFNMQSNYLTIPFVVISIAIGIILLWKLTDPSDQVLFTFIFGILAYFFTQVDIWSNQLPFLFPFLIIASCYISKDKLRKWYTVLYLLYPIAAECFILLYIDRVLLLPIIPIVSFALLGIIILVVVSFYQKSQESTPNSKVVPHTNGSDLSIHRSELG